MLSPNFTANFKPFTAAVFILALGLAGTSGGCAPQGALQEPDTPMKNEYALGKSLLNDVFSVYKNYSRDSFDKVVSRDFTPVRSEYVNGVERGFYGAQQIDLYPIVDSVVTNKDLVSVSFHWEKKVATYTGGNYRNLTGRAEYVFRQQSGAWYLYKVGGDDPMAMN